MRRHLAVLALLSLTACGGGGGFDDTRALAAELGCADSHKLDPADTMSLGAKETATCDGPGGDYSLAVFAGEDQRDAFVEAVGSFGGAFAVGDGWAVGAQNVEDAKKAAETLGGETL